MLIKNTPTRFGIVAILLHWLMALMLIGQVIVGFYMTTLSVSLEKLQYYGWHKEFGILILMLAIVRLTWRLSNTTPTLSNLQWWERYLARAAHYAFYGFMIALPLSGWCISSAADLRVSFFGLFSLPNLVSASEGSRIFYTEIHEALAFGLIATFCLHVAGAMKHFIIDRDDILQRMLKP